ncbi:MAG TPA: DUF4286 family protein [Puia sp.]|nr:DUF4286 family protein [Puia sp.]
MIVYNITYKVHREIDGAWFEWQKGVQMPGIVATGLFDDCKCWKLLDQDEEEGPTYVIQYFTSTIERYEQFLVGHAPSFRKLGREKWGNGFIGFETLMQSV